MRALRLPVLSALLVLLLTAGHCNLAALPPGPGTRMEGGSVLELDGDRSPKSRTETPTDLTEHSVKTPERGGNKSQQILHVYTRDLRHKEKFLKHLTGPLYFNPKCRKHFYRLYHNTRDCTIPAYYKRCARLLTRLASSPRCTER
ncbi:ALK and LTK ligand 2b-like [Centroberyx affinis]|uniref:ALK and LTK ligand 2b-like n=1 Tax=Centroberyx affinis TaxID=166261 RepID=UPI003A5BCCD4